jgi:5-methylcytosine-specific restriction endonuclease McrA
MHDEHRIAIQLVQTRKWSFDHALAAVRANFKCEYCGLDLLTDAQHYKLWQLDYIVPKKLMMQADWDPEDLDNLAIACKPCNFDFEWRFDPRDAAGVNADRTALINAAKAEIERKKRVCDDELARVREIIGRGAD